MNAITLHRLGHWFAAHRVPVAPKLTYAASYLLFNSSIPAACAIGEGTRFAYGGIGVVIHGDCKIGKRVLIGQNVTLGGNFGSGVPVIGDNVYIGPGARILGSVTVGNNVIIGANAVVLRNVPDNCIIAGVPARVIREIPPDALDAIAGTLHDGSNLQRLERSRSIGI